MNMPYDTCSTCGERTHLFYAGDSWACSHCAPNGESSEKRRRPCPACHSSGVRWIRKGEGRIFAACPTCKGKRTLWSHEVDEKTLNL